VIELQGDQERHDLPEDELEDPVIQGIQSPEHEGVDDTDDEANESDEETAPITMVSA